MPLSLDEKRIIARALLEFGEQQLVHDNMFGYRCVRELYEKNFELFLEVEDGFYHRDQN
jgi:hypothetical protein